MKGSGPCKNKQWVDEWETVELVPKDTDTQEEVDQLRAQEWHLNAEHLEAGEFFAIKVDDEEEEDHNFYVCYALGPRCRLLRRRGTTTRTSWPRDPIT